MNAQRASLRVSDCPQHASKSIEQRLAELETETIDDTAARQRAAEQLERERLTEANRRKSLLDTLNRKMGRRYAGCDLSNYQATTADQREALADVTRYVMRLHLHLETGSGALLYGPPGTGKDHFAAVIVRTAVMECGASVEWTDGSDFYGAIRDNIDGDKTEAAFLKRFTSPALLVMSDPLPPAGAIKSEFQLSMLFRVIDRRYRDMRATVMTLNVANRSEAEQRLSPNIVDRLAHGAMAIHCNWPSYRRGGN